MAKQLGITDISTPACCTPMVDEPLTESAAVELSKGFKALGDPVRLRLLSLIAAHPDGGWLNHVTVASDHDASD